MAINIKPDKRFRFVILFSAFIISLMAATFSVTGIATLFSGYFLYVAFMMGVLEFGKIIVASMLARYWKKLSKLLRFYFTTAVLVLILITSAGIFGYLSDAYQTTKGDYTLVEKETKILESKKQFFLERKDRLVNDRDAEKRTLRAYQTRADSIIARGGGIGAIDRYIVESNQKLDNIENQISSMEDSVGTYDLAIINLESKNLKGELGPLKYIADVFDTNMDTIVKYLIFILIFVFDPLAILLFVSSNTLIRKEIEEMEKEGLIKNEKATKFNIVKNLFKNKKKEVETAKEEKEELKSELKDKLDDFIKNQKDLDPEIAEVLNQMQNNNLKKEKRLSDETIKSEKEDFKPEVDEVIDNSMNKTENEPLTNNNSNTSTEESTQDVPDSDKKKVDENVNKVKPDKSGEDFFVNKGYVESKDDEVVTEKEKEKMKNLLNKEQNNTNSNIGNTQKNKKDKKDTKDAEKKKSDQEKYIWASSNYKNKKGNVKNYW